MLIQTNAIVLQQFRYTDNSIIAHVLTESHGKIPLIIRASRGRKSKNKALYFQPFYILELELDYKDKREIQGIKELRVKESLYNITSDVRKNTIVMFLAEILQKTLKDQQVDNALFQFVYHSIILFENMEEGSSNFHLYFTIQFMKFLGFYPGNEYSEDFPYLSAEAGLFVSSPELSSSCFTKEESMMFSYFMKISPADLPLVNISRMSKTLCLQAILSYYEEHIPGFKNLKSYDVLREVFSQ